MQIYEDLYIYINIYIITGRCDIYHHSFVWDEMLLGLEVLQGMHISLCPRGKFIKDTWVNVTTGYTLVKTRHSRVPTYLQRETDTADWSTPTFTLPCPKNGGVYIPCHVYL